MSEKIKRLRDKVNERQAKFFEEIVNGKNRADAYWDAGFETKDRQQANTNAYRLMNKCANGIAYWNALKEELERKASISRGVQLSRLNMLFDMAVKQKNVPAAKGVITEMNEMLGYHRELAPNTEQEQARKDLKAKEAEELERLGRERTSELSEPKIVKIGDCDSA